MIVKRILVLSLCLGMVAACAPEIFTPYYPTISQSPRFDINHYTEVATADTDLTGLWMMVQSGTRDETINNINYRTTGFSREIVEIYENGGNLYAKACIKAEEAQQLVSVNVDEVTVELNNHNMTLTKTGFKNMSGSAASASPGDFSYSGSVSMKKIAPLGTSMGSFSFYNSSLSMDSLNADCFQESDVGLTGVVGIISKYALLEIFNAVDWSIDGSTYSQTAYIYHKGGNATAVKTITYVDGADVTGVVASRAYPGDNQTFSRNQTTVDASNFDVSYNVTGVGGFVGSTAINVP